MWIEVVAAVLVGASLLWLVFEPIFASGSLSAPEALEVDSMDEVEDTRSGMALSALKEIEFDRETGKLSDADYEFLKHKYTGEALSALRAEDGGAPACAICGDELTMGSRFCGSCGGRVAA